MLDAVSLVKTKLYDQWTETNPPKTGDGKVFFVIDEFDEVASYPQILVSDDPANIATESLGNGKYKINHGVAILVYLRPVKYDATTMNTARTTFRNMINEIERILIAQRYNIAGIKDVVLGNWDWQTNRIFEPVVLVAQTIARCVYFK